MVEIAKATTAASPQDASALSELETRLAARLKLYPGETRQVATFEILKSDPSLYQRVRQESTYDAHGRTLAAIQPKATVSFGVDHRGRPVTKSQTEIEADVLRRAATVIAKCSTPVTMDKEVAAIFHSNPELYAEWRAASPA